LAMVVHTNCCLDKSTCLHKSNKEKTHRNSIPRDSD
jgi:hypothetical protein